VRDVVLDTDAASLLQKQQAPPWVLRHVDGARVWLTFVAVGELAKWAVVRRWGEDRRRRLDDWTAGRPVIPYDTQIARVWGALAGAAQLRGRPRLSGPGRRMTPGSRRAACATRYRW
jgi:predicted nucleic acid-binding protein